MDHLIHHFWYCIVVWTVTCGSSIKINAFIHQQTTCGVGSVCKLLEQVDEQSSLARADYNNYKR